MQTYLLLFAADWRSETNIEYELPHLFIRAGTIQTVSKIAGERTYYVIAVELIKFDETIIGQFEELGMEYIGLGGAQ